METEENFWERLFEAGEPKQSVEMRLVRKRGRAFLLLPRKTRLAAQVLELYPAQSRPARVARAALRWTLLAHLPIGSGKVSVSFSPADSFVAFLTDLIGISHDQPPALGILSGNPNSSGRRFICLLFDASGNPAAVVKAGLAADAQGLIDCEKTFFESMPKQMPGVPKLRAAFAVPRLHALAFDFFPGRSPRTRDETAIPSLLGSWIDEQQQIPVSQTLVWQELERAGTPHPVLEKLKQKLHGKSFRRTIYHGDFAPWNIKVSPAGEWTVLDWERGDVNGVPAWDWFHYALQTSILVGRKPTSALIERLETLLASEEFGRYAQLSTITGVERQLAMAYLLHHCEVVRPSEGLMENRELLAALTQRWLKSP